MINLDSLKNSMQVSGILVIPLFVVAYLNEFGLSHFPEPKEFLWTLNLFYFFLIVGMTFLANELIFSVIKLIENIVYKIVPSKFYKIGSVFGFFAISFISFGLLGFYKSGPIEGVKDTWFIAVGTYGLSILRLQIEARRATIYS